MTPPPYSSAIVRAVNCHEALVDALKMIRNEIESDEEEQSVSFSTTATWFEILNQADAALALAEGGK